MTPALLMAPRPEFPWQDAVPLNRLRDYNTDTVTFVIRGRHVRVSEHALRSARSFVQVVQRRYYGISARGEADKI